MIVHIQSCDHNLLILFSLGGGVWWIPFGNVTDLEGGGGGAAIGSYWRSFGSRTGLRLLLPDVLPLSLSPPPSLQTGGELYVWASSVAIATKA